MLRKFNTADTKESFATANTGFKILADVWRNFKTELPQTARGVQTAGILLGAGLLLSVASIGTLASAFLIAGCVSFSFSSLFLLPVEAKRNKEIITETKDGQTLCGPRSAFKTLKAAQLRIDRYLSKNFNNAAGDLPQDQQAQINLIIEEAAPAHNLVKVLDAEGKEIAGAKYKFNCKIQTSVALNV